MKYKVGDKVKIKSLEWYNENKDENGRVLCDYIGFCKEMTKYCGKVLTIMTIGNQDIGSKQKYFMHETDYAWGFTDEMIECLADEPQEKMVSLDKVCKWLRANIDLYADTRRSIFSNYQEVYLTDNFETEFRKAMEE